MYSFRFRLSRKRVVNGSVQASGKLRKGEHGKLKKHVVFDFGGVLRVKTKARDGVIANLLQKVNRELQFVGSDTRVYSETEVIEAFKRPHWGSVGQGNLSRFEAYSKSFFMHGISSPTFVEDFMKEFDHGAKVILPQMVNLLKKLRKKSDVKVWILSNHSKELLDVLSELNLVPRLIDESRVLISAITGLRKPAEEAYLNLIYCIGENVERKNILFVDNREANVEVAESLGISAILYKFEPTKCGENGEGDRTVKALTKEILEFINRR